ncbi:MAG: GTP-binding protein [Terrimicrobiaceae bacterium]
MDSRVPVTILTGFLGAGKTTLLNRILTEQHGLRIAVIENEFGEIGIDHELVLNTEEELFEMNNGCICCTVRGDLIRILGNLMKRRNQFEPFARFDWDGANLIVTWSPDGRWVATDDLTPSTAVGQK